MPNAYVLIHHFGDEGNVSEGMILRDLPSKRFDELKRRELVREATAAELKAGYRPPFEREGDSGGELTALQKAEALNAELLGVRSELDAAIQRAATAEEERDTLRLRVEELVDAKSAVVGELDTTRADLDTARAQIAELKAAAAEKAAEPPENKQAADPANKAGGKSAPEKAS